MKKEKKTKTEGWSGDEGGGRKIMLERQIDRYIESVSERERQRKRDIERKRERNIQIIKSERRARKRYRKYKKQISLVTI